MICPICHLEEPMVWSDQPMNETIRPYAKAYISPVKIQHQSIWHALNAWGQAPMTYEEFLNIEKE